MTKEKTGYPSIDKTHLRDTKFLERHPIIPTFLTFSQLLDLMFAIQGEHYVLDCLDLRVTSKEFQKDSLTLAKTLLELGVKKDDIVSVAMPNYYHGVPVFKATNMIGAITTYLNPNAEMDEIVSFLNMYNSEVFINFDKSQEYNNEIKRRTKVKHVITLDSKLINSRDYRRPIDFSVGNKDDFDFHQLGHIADQHKGNFKVSHGGKQDALILYTSGSTGKSKSLLFTNENLIASCIYLKNSTHLPNPSDGDRRWMSVVPFMYPYGFGAGVLQTMLAGREVILTPNLSASNVGEFYKKKPDVILGSPAHLELTKRNLDEDIRLDNLSTYVSGGDYLSVSQSKDAIEFFRKHGADVAMCNSSGTGETLGCSTNAMMVPYRPETVGQLVLGPDYVILDSETMEEVKYGETGVLCTTGKHVFKGYYGRDDLTDEIMITYKGKKYYMTGNIGYLDENRYFTLVGRASRFFIVNTLNKVYCELIQNVLASIDVVDSCAIVPKPHDERLYCSKAYVVLKPGVEPCKEVEEYIIEKCHETFNINGEIVSLKDYEIPTSITFLDILPRTEMAEKIDYELMKQMAQEEYDREKNGGELILKHTIK